MTYLVYSLAHQDSHWELSNHEWEMMRGGETWVRMRRNRIELRLVQHQSRNVHLTTRHTMSWAGMGSILHKLVREWLRGHASNLYWLDLTEGEGEVFFLSDEDAFAFKLAFHQAKHEAE